MSDSPDDRRAGGRSRPPTLAVVGLLARGAVRRRLPWAPLAVAAATGVTLVALQAREDGIDPVLAARLLAVLLGVTVAAALEDPGEALTDTTPVGRAPLRSLRLVAGAIVVAPTWAGFLLASSVIGGAEVIARRSIVAGLTVELAALAAIGALLAALAVRRSAVRSSAVAAAVGLVVGVGLSLSLQRLAGWLWVGGGDPGWRVAHMRWTVLGLLAFGGVIWSCRDPAARVAPARSAWQPSGNVRSGPVRSRLRWAGSRRDGPFRSRSLRSRPGSGGARPGGAP